MGVTSAQSAYGPPQPAKPTMGFSQFAYQPQAEQPHQPHYGQGRNVGPPAETGGVTFGSPAQIAPGDNSGMDDELASFMAASPVKMKPPHEASPAQPHYGQAGRRVGPPGESVADPWAPPSNGGPHGVSIDVPLGSSDDALDGFIGSSDLGSPAKDFGAPPNRSESAMGGGGWSDSRTAAAVRLQGEFGAAGPQDLPPRGLSMPELAQEPPAVANPYMAARANGGDARTDGGFGGGRPGAQGGLGAFGAAAAAAAPEEKESLWGFGRTERKELPTISGLDVDKALTLIRDKIQARLEGGPSELRRAFQFFDADGGGRFSPLFLRVSVEKCRNCPFFREFQ